MPIKEELKKSLVFGFAARLPIGIILGFVDDRHEVMPLMQTISHGTRAYLVNANGLPGFVSAYDIIRHLKVADMAGQLEHARKWQVIDISLVEKSLENLTSLEQKMDYLSEAYPSLYILILKHFKMPERIESFMAKCKEYEDSPENYSLYIHGFFLVWLDQQRQAGKLTQGKKFNIFSLLSIVKNKEWTNNDGKDYLYTGEVD